MAELKPIGLKNPKTGKSVRLHHADAVRDRRQWEDAGYTEEVAPEDFSTLNAPKEPEKQPEPPKAPKGK